MILIVRDFQMLLYVAANHYSFILCPQEYDKTLIVTKYTDDGQTKKLKGFIGDNLEDWQYANLVGYISPEPIEDIAKKIIGGFGFTYKDYR